MDSQGLIQGPGLDTPVNAYLNRRYGLGLEAQYLEAGAGTMTIEQLELAKADLQSRIWAGNDYGERRCRARKPGEPADELDTETTDECEDGFYSTDEL